MFLHTASSNWCATLLFRLYCGFTCVSSHSIIKFVCATLLFRLDSGIKCVSSHSIIKCGLLVLPRAECVTTWPLHSFVIHYSHNYACDMYIASCFPIHVGWRVTSGCKSSRFPTAGEGARGRLALFDKKIRDQTFSTFSVVEFW